MLRTGSVGTVSQATVVNVPDEHRYEISLDGEMVGMTVYTELPGQRIFFHTEVDDDYEGQGLASVLVRAALEDTRDAGLRVVPICPYVKRWVGEHHDFDDVLDPPTLAAVEAVRKAQGS